MKLVGLVLLDSFKQKHAPSRGPLDAWRLSVEKADWSDGHDVRKRHATASFIGDNRIIFNIKGNAYRLVVKVKYTNGVVLIEWIGTHAEYSKLNLNK